MRALALAVAVLGGVASPAAATEAKAPTRAERVRQLGALALEIGQKVERLRGLPFKRPVAVKVVDDAEARRYFEGRARRLWPEEKVRLEEQAYAQLGLVPPGTRLLEALLDLLEEQAAAYYDPESDTFFVLDDMPEALAPVFMAHELTHALDDQHYDIEAMLAAVREDDDRGTAVTAVVEGSGTLVMSLFLAQETQAGRIRPDVFSELQKTDAGKAGKLRAAPALLQRSLMAPYALGLTFLLRGNLGRLASSALGADIDAAFQKPPQSSEQVLHPEKYWDEKKREAPRPVKLPDLAQTLGEGWTQRAHGTLGELSVGILVGAPTPDASSPRAAEPGAWTNAAASGLAGDAWQLYGRGGEAVTVLVTRWDSEKDAEEFAAALPAREQRRAYRYADGVAVVAGAVGPWGDALGGRLLGLLQSEPARAPAPAR